MPTPVYSIIVRGREINGSHRCADKEEAQGVYDQLAKAVNAPEEFFEITLGTTVTMARKDNIAGFSLSVQMEETPEERKARAIAEIERYGSGSALNYPQAEKRSSQGLIGNY
jgi:hypothetical protein